MEWKKCQKIHVDGRSDFLFVMYISIALQDDGAKADDEDAAEKVSDWNVGSWRGNTSSSMTGEADCQTCEGVTSTSFNFQHILSWRVVLMKPVCATFQWDFLDEAQAAPAPDLLDMSDPPPAPTPAPAPSLSDVDLLGPVTTSVTSTTPSTSLPQDRMIAFTHDMLVQKCKLNFRKLKRSCMLAKSEFHDFASFFYTRGHLQKVFPQDFLQDLDLLSPPVKAPATLPNMGAGLGALGGIPFDASAATLPGSANLKWFEEILFKMPTYFCVCVSIKCSVK